MSTFVSRAIAHVHPNQLRPTVPYSLFYLVAVDHVPQRAEYRSTYSVPIFLMLAAVLSHASGEETILPGASMLSWRRFDIYIKSAYARFVLRRVHGEPESGVNEAVPPFVTAVYTEHERVWNGLCEYPNCWKVGPANFISAFHSVINSIHKNGYNQSMEGPSERIIITHEGTPCEGAHRLAASIALAREVGVVRMHAGVRCEYPKPGFPEWDYVYFRRMGYQDPFADWVMHHSIVADSSLYVLHVWPVAVSQGSRRLAKAAAIARRQCSVEGGIVYHKKIALSPSALLIYLKLSYSHMETLDPSNYHAPDTSSPLYMFVVRSTPARMTACELQVRQLYSLKAPLFESASSATTYHSDSIIAAQMLLNDNSIAYMHQVVDASTCTRLASEISTDVHHSIGLAPPRVGSGRRRTPVRQLPEDLLVDTGAMGLLDLTNVTDLHLVWSFGDPTAVTLLRYCRVAGRCRHVYGTHNPPSVWFKYHGVLQPEVMVHDPSRYAFCAGLKFVSPVQLLAYKQKRYARRLEPEGKAKDLREIKQLTSLLVSCNVHDPLSHPFCCDHDSRANHRLGAQQGCCGDYVSSSARRRRPVGDRSCGVYAGNNSVDSSVALFSRAQVLGTICRVAKCLGTTRFQAGAPIHDRAARRHGSRRLKVQGGG